MVPAETLPRLLLRSRAAAPIRPHGERRLTLPDGRRLGIAEFGLRDGPPAVYLHGFMGSRLEPGVIGAVRCRIIGIDRPGYGWSDRQPLPSLAAFGRDVAHALDAIGVQSCVLVGVSSGAGYAIAAAAAMGARARHLLIIGGVAAPPVLSRAGGKAGYLLRLGRAGGLGGRMRRHALRTARFLGGDRALVGLTVAAERPAIAALGFDPDVIHERLLQSLRTGSGWGVAGPLADGRLLSRPWDVDPSGVSTPATVIHGEADPVVPAAHGRWLASVLPRAELRLMPDAMHLTACFASADLVQAAPGLCVEACVGDPDRPEDPN